MEDTNPQRRDDDLKLAVLAQKFDDHLDRYDRDSENTQDWRRVLFARNEDLAKTIAEIARQVSTLAPGLQDATDRLKIHCKFINEISPIYKRLCWVLGVVATASIGVIVVAFFKHISWH